MVDTAFDTLGAARKLKAAGVEAGQAEANVEVMGQSVNQLVTVERFEAGNETLHARIDAFQTELLARIDALCTELRAEIARSLLIAVGVMIAANAFMMTILGIMLTGAASLD